MTDPTYTGACVECGAALPYGGHVATPFCDACLEKPVGPFPQEPAQPLILRNMAGEVVPVPELEEYLRQPIGPWPQEPAPGSPEAVEQAAETIRTYQPHRATLEEVEARRERDAARAEVERIRQQRDALADALVLYTTGDDCGCCDGSPDQPASTSCAYCTGMAALRKAGR